MEGLASRVKASFPGMYITLLSILQAIALESLVARVSDLSGLLNADFRALVMWLQIVFLFHTIVYVWFYLSFLVMTLRWVPGLLETFFPFAIAVAQLSAIAWIGLERVSFWFAAIFGGSGVGALAWPAFRSRMAREPENEHVLRAATPGTMVWPLSAIALITLLGLLASGTEIGGVWSVEILLGMANAGLVIATARFGALWRQVSRLDAR